MLGLIYSVLLLLAGAALIGGLMSWRTLARVKRLERALALLQRERVNPDDSIKDSATAAAGPEAPTEQPRPEDLPDTAKVEEIAATATASVTSEPSAISRLTGELKQNWMVWLGGFCVALAGIFLAKYSIDAGLLGPSARVFAACSTGIALHVLAEWLRRRTGESHPAFAALAGGASITLYSAVLAALHLYQLLEPGAALLLLALIALATMALSLLHGPALAIIGILGAYTVPILVANDEGDILSSLAYATIISGAALLLMRHVYRHWLWYGMLVGALGWWLISFANIESGAVRGYYLAALAYGMLAIPTGDWRLAGATAEHPVMKLVTIKLFRSRPFNIPLIAVSILLVTCAWALSIAHTGFSPDALLHWSPLVLVVLLAARERQELALLPWLSLFMQWFGWLYSVLVVSGGQWQLNSLNADLQQDFLWFALGMSVVYSGLTLLMSHSRTYSNLRGSLIALAPVCWLALAYLLVTDLSSIWQWSLISLAIGLIYIILSQRSLKHDESGTASNAIWLILAAHLAYSLALAMFFREATLTLALATQLISLTWLIRRFDLHNLDWLVKAVLALIVTRLTLNPWLLSYPTDLHWSLWTYGGATACCMVASRLTRTDAKLKLWLEAVSLQLFVLFVAAETRYQLYDGEIFRSEYSLTEAAINTALWAGVGLIYHYRAQISDYLNGLYNALSQILLLMGLVNYLLVLTLLNPFWSGALSVGSQPLANLLLLAYGVPPLLALLAWRFYQPRFRRLAAIVAAVGGLIFISMEIRHLWQKGLLDIDLPTSDGELYTYSAVWLVLAVVAILYASRRQWQSAYKGGMALLMLVIAKLFLVDMAGLEGLLRVASFMGLGLSLLALAYLYQRISANNQQQTRQ
jgi:uncharacterized membrane protein